MVLFEEAKYNKDSKNWSRCRLSRKIHISLPERFYHSIAFRSFACRFHSDFNYDHYIQQYCYTNYQKWYFALGKTNSQSNLRNCTGTYNSWLMLLSVIHGETCLIKRDIFESYCGNQNPLKTIKVSTIQCAQSSVLLFITLVKRCHFHGRNHERKY